MKRIDEEYACLLAAPNLVEVSSAKQLLADAGIPCLVHGPDFDRAELGLVMHDGVTRRPDLYVRKETYARAKAVLDQAWGRKEDCGAGAESG